MLTRQDFNNLQSMSDIFKMSGSDFEYFSKFLLEQMNYKNVFVTKKYGEFRGDGGVDGTATKDNQKVHIQAKLWKRGFNGYLPVAVIRELGGCMLRDNIENGVIVTTLNFDKLCEYEAGKMGILLIGTADIAKAMRSVNPRFSLLETPSLLQRILRAFASFLRLLFSNK